MLEVRPKHGKRLCLVAVASLWLVSGCGGDGPQAVSVQGAVHHRNQPVEAAVVKFWSAGGNLYAGSTDAEGRFQFDVEIPQGASGEEFAVAVSKQEQAPSSGGPEDPYAPTREVLPARYGSRIQSGLNAKVTVDGENSFDFQLDD